MIYALVHYPHFDVKNINQLRVNYDLQVELIEPHITLMFPVPASVGEEALVHHLENILDNWRSFSIHLQGFQISPDDHLFLLIREGKANLIRLYDEIYTGSLAAYRRDDVPFVPHLTLGLLNNDSNQRNRVSEEARGLGIDHYCMADKLHLLKVNDDRSKIVWSKEFALAS